MDDLDRQWAATHRQLLLLACGATTSFEQKVTTGEKVYHGPTFRHQELAEYESRWAGATADRDRIRILEDATVELFYHATPFRRQELMPDLPEQTQRRLRLLALGRDLVQLRGTEPWKVAVATHGQITPGTYEKEATIRAVAQLYDEPVGSVHAWRQKYGQKLNGHQPQVDVIRSTLRFLRDGVAELDAITA